MKLQNLKSKKSTEELSTENQKLNQQNDAQNEQIFTLKEQNSQQGNLILALQRQLDELKKQSIQPQVKSPFFPPKLSQSHELVISTMEKKQDRLPTKIERSAPSPKGANFETQQKEKTKNVKTSIVKQKPHPKKKEKFEVVKKESRREIEEKVTKGTISTPKKVTLQKTKETITPKSQIPLPQPFTKKELKRKKTQAEIEAEDWAVLDAICKEKQKEQQIFENILKAINDNNLEEAQKILSENRYPRVEPVGIYYVLYKKIVLIA